MQADLDVWIATHTTRTGRIKGAGASANPDCKSADLHGAPMRTSLAFVSWKDRKADRARDQGDVPVREHRYR